MRVHPWCMVVACAVASLGTNAQAERPWTRTTAWERLSAERQKQAFEFGARYVEFLNRCKTEREVVRCVAEKSRERGFAELQPGRALGAGDRVLLRFGEKALVLAVVGAKPLEEGSRLVAAHADSVRIDLKPTPVYEDANLVLLETQYYGRLGFAQWLARPLALHGVVYRAGGQRVELRIGSEPADPVFVIPDVVVYLRGRVRGESGDALPAEKLDPIVASLPDGAPGPTRGRFRRAFLALLEKRHGVRAEDLRSAELSLVPAGRARSVGLDEALVGAYGHDGRAGVFSAAEAILALREAPQHTALVAIFDKAEVGSVGAEGASSSLLARALGALLRARPGAAADERTLRDVLARSRALEASVVPGVAPHFKRLHERRNAAFVGSGPTLLHRFGHAEARHALRRALENANVPYQIADFSRASRHAAAEPSIAPFLSRLGFDTLQLSVPVLSLHAPFEVASKVDVFLTAAAFEGFFRFR